jgi:hypothetical protein
MVPSIQVTSCDLSSVTKGRTEEIWDRFQGELRAPTKERIVSHRVTQKVY